MKHAYLIIAHHEFEVLQKLIYALDDERNDIYVHIDTKVQKMPELTAHSSLLFVLNDRIDVRWGDISQIKCEYKLFENASMQGVYAYYHLISGVHLPLYSQDYIHDFFNKSFDTNCQLLSPLAESEAEVNDKLRRYNLFMRSYQHENPIFRKLYQKMWWAAILYQNRFRILRNRPQKFIKASNWVSLTGDAVEYLLSIKKEVVRKYRFTRCADEFFVPSELANSAKKKKWNLCFESRLLKHEITLANAGVFTLSDFENLMDSECLFARKFSGENMDLVEKIVAMLPSRI
ncbi:MAG: glycosyltransferase [Bacteroidetes bacterium]|nr:glycosyltransferase [Bacteroidota bacterium]